ncbi:hypothetical protein [Flavobacterium sp.]|uniref:hypothetical protein n=1 Tax=Flavobacterium sp. TaxID=239 RepID=UPI0025BFB40C|nr:hypothetical protein [Flavobacterium sp.]MBA4153495.1 hypothetical protein [Flavobacterium sp.]
MKKLVYWLLLLPFVIVAQEIKESKILSISEITVKEGHNKQFLEGVKQWKECYLENKGTESWNLWKQFQGNGHVYVMTGVNKNFAELDMDDSAGKSCRDIVTDFIMPHVESVNYNIASTMPDVSRDFMEGTKIVWVNFYRVKNGVIFTDLIKERVSIIKEVEGSPRSFWYSYMGGGPNAPHYFVSTPFKSFADMDVKRDNVWKLIEKAKGKKKADQLRDAGRAVIENSWSYIYVLNEELSK